MAVTSLSTRLAHSTALTLRPYQQDAINELNARFDSGCGALLLVMPCGAGKTETAIGLAFSRPGRVLVVAHRRELIFQTYNRFRARGVPAEDITILMADEDYNPDAKFCVASIQTIARRGAVPEAELLIIDEAHLSLAPSYINLSMALKTRGAKIVGMTATPYKGGGKVWYHEMYDDYVIGVQPCDLIQAGYILKPNYYITSTFVDVNKLKLSGFGETRDYDAESFTETWLSVNGPASFLDALETYAPGMQTIVFNPNIKLAEFVNSLLVAQGYAAEIIHSELPRVVVQERVNAFRNHEIQILVNVSILCEGFDLPSCECVVLNLATMSKSRFVQMVGRVQRPGKPSDRCVVIDTANNIERLGPPWGHIIPEFSPPLAPPHGNIPGAAEEEVIAPGRGLEEIGEVKSVDYVEYEEAELLPWQTSIPNGRFVRRADVLAMYPVCGEAAKVIADRFGPIIVVDSIPVPAYFENIAGWYAEKSEKNIRNGVFEFKRIMRILGAPDEMVQRVLFKRLKSRNANII